MDTTLLLRRLNDAEARLAWWERCGNGFVDRIRKIVKGDVWYLLYQLSKKRRIPISGTTFWGHKFHCYLPDYLFLRLYGVLGDSAELPLTAFVVKHVKPGDVFLDIGASCGFYSSLAATLVGPSGEVHAFEPTPEICSMLRRNTNGLPVTTVECAVSDRSGTARLAVGVQAVGNSITTNGESGITVRTVRLDDYCAGLVPSFIKIDAEGAEHLVVRGAASMLKSATPIVFLEIRKGVDEKPYRDAVGLLERLGYHPHRLTPDGSLERADAVFIGVSRGFENLAFLKT